MICRSEGKPAAAKVSLLSLPYTADPASYRTSVQRRPAGQISCRTEMACMTCSRALGSHALHFSRNNSRSTGSRQVRYDQCGDEPSSAAPRPRPVATKSSTPPEPGLTAEHARVNCSAAPSESCEAVMVLSTSLGMASAVPTTSSVDADRERGILLMFRGCPAGTLVTNPNPSWPSGFPSQYVTFWSIDPDAGQNVNFSLAGLSANCTCKPSSERDLRQSWHVAGRATSANSSPMLLLDEWKTCMGVVHDAASTKSLAGPQHLDSPKLYSLRVTNQPQSPWLATEMLRRVIVDDDDEEGYSSSSSENMSPAARAEALRRLPPLDVLSGARLPVATDEQRTDFMGRFVEQAKRMLTSDDLWEFVVMHLGDAMCVFERKPRDESGRLDGWNVCLQRFPMDRLVNVYGAEAPVQYLSMMAEEGERIVVIGKTPNTEPGATDIEAVASLRHVREYIASHNPTIVCLPSVESLDDLGRVLQMAIRAMVPGTPLTVDARSEEDETMHTFLYDFYFGRFIWSNSKPPVSAAAAGGRRRKTRAAARRKTTRK